MEREYEEFAGLLEFCMKRISCNYLSDVHSLRNRESMLRVVSIIPAERYSVHEWVDALNYIADTHYKEDMSAERAKKILLNVLRVGHERQDDL